MNTQNLSFTTNWNGKLLLDVFGTVRIHNPDKYAVNKELLVDLRGKELGFVKVEAIRVFEFRQITDALAFIDMGKPAYYMAAVFTKMYGSKGTMLPSTPLDHIIVRYTKRFFPNQQLVLQEWWQSTIDQQPATVQQSLFD